MQPVEAIDKGAAPGPPPLSSAAKRLTLAATVTGSSMGFIDGSVVNVALPAIQHGLGASAGAVQWTVSGYLLLLGALVLVGGAAADRYGRRKIFELGIVLFTAASLACALAPNGTALVVGRLLQGAAAALFTPASLAILGASFPEAERGRAIGAWAGFAALTSAAGPVLGGWLVDVLSWRAIFLLNIPLAAATLAFSRLGMPESRAPEARGLDWPGAALVAGGLGLLTFALTEAGTGRGFGSGAVLLPLAAGIALLGGFILVEARTAEPMVPFALFRSRDFTGCNVLTLLLYFALGGALFLLPFELVRVRGYTATEAGAALLPLSLVLGTLSGLAGRLGDRIGPRLPLTLGPIIAAGGLAALAYAPAVPRYWAGLLPAMLLLAAGMTLTVAPLTATVIGAVDRGHAGTASGINNAVARLAGLFAVALLGLAFNAGFDRGITRSGIPIEQRPAPGSGLTVRPQGSPPALAAAETAALGAAYRLAMLLAAGAAAGAGVVGGLTIAAGRPGGPGRARPGSGGGTP